MFLIWEISYYFSTDLQEEDQLGSQDRCDQEVILRNFKFLMTFQIFSRLLLEEIFIQRLIEKMRGTSQRMRGKKDWELHGEAHSSLLLWKAEKSNGIMLCMTESVLKRILKVWALTSYITRLIQCIKSESPIRRSSMFLSALISVIPFLL